MAISRRNPNNPTDDMYNVWIDNFSDNQRQTIEQTQAWMDNLRQSTIDSSISNVWIRSDLTIQQRWLEYERDMHTLVWFLSVVDKLLEEIEDTKSWLSKKWLSKAWKKTIKEAKTKLNQYEKQLKAKRKALSKQGRAEIYDNDISHLRDLQQQVNKVRQDIWMWQWWDFASTASYLYNSPEIARKSNEHQADNLEFEQKLQTEVKKWAILHIFNWVEHKANEFYRRIAEWRYTRADYELFITNSAVLTPSFQRCGIAIPTWPIQSQWRVERVSWTTRRSVDYSNMDWWETLEKWWVAGVLDKLLSNCGNMTPWQRNTWKSLWVLACFAGWIYWLYKFYTSDKMWFWSKACITAWTIFWSQALTGEWPLSLFNKLITGGLSMDELKNKFGNVVWWLGSSESTEITWWTTWTSWEIVSESVVPAMYSMMIFNSSTKVSDISTMTQSFSDNANRKAFYEQSCSKLEKDYGTQAVECFRATFTDQFDENKWTNRLASIWIVLGTTNSDESVYWLANNATMNATILEKFQTENWLKVTNKAALQAYLKDKKTNNKAIDIDDLNKSGWFSVNKEATYTERPEDIQNRKDLVSKVEWLSMDATKKEELKQAIQDFYNERQIKNKPNLNDFSLRIENWLLIMKSHDWNETKIDLNNCSIKCNNSEFQLYNLSEALNIADLTNYILQQTNKKTPAGFPVFSYHLIPQKAICFNDNSGRLNFFDTSILNINLIRNRETVDKNASSYANYLSNHRLENNKVNIDAYPMIKSTKIDFTNSKEANEAEELLKTIKHELRMREKRDSWDAFEISTNVITTKTYIKFFTKWWKTKEFDISNYPTLIRNKDKLLKYINNPSNKMRESQRWT